MKNNRFYRLTAGTILAVLLVCALPLGTFAIGDPPSQAGSKVLSGGQRDFAFPVPGHSMLSSCFYDNRNHCALDFPAPKGTPVVASYDGTVIATYNGCEHNWGGDCGCGFGNYVVLKHDYVLKVGEHITLYSSYNHLTKATVSLGQTVSKGQQVGTMGSTGYSTGHHLDYQILYGGLTPFRSYSIDPYINELLELPEGLHSMNSGGCCSRYVAYVKEYYPRCLHESFSAEGSCTGCGYTFDWSSTRSTAVMGIYSTVSDITPAAKPYSASLGTAGQAIAAGTEVSVSASVTNGAEESWYELKDGTYLPKSALTFVRYLDSEFQCQVTSPTEGQTLKQQSHTLSGSISSLYPLRKVSGYLDGICYGSWTGSSSATTLALSGTDINNKLYFSTLSPGKHTLTITAADASGREEVTVAECTFYIEQPPTFYTVTFDPNGGNCENSSISVQEGYAVGTLPTPQKDGHSFTGWYTESGAAANAETIVNQATTLYAHWEPLSYTVTFGEIQQTVTYGQTATELPEVTQEGYAFLGWFTAEDGGSEFTLQTSVTGDITLFPHWEGLPYDVTLDPGEGKVAWYTKTVTYGSNYGAFPTPKLDGYLFCGWMLDNEPITNTTAVATAKDHTLTALWEPIETVPSATEVPATETPEITAPDTLPENRFPLWIVFAVLALLTGAALAFVLIRRKQSAEAAEETPVEEAAAEEFPVEDVPAVETPAEETPAEETPVEEEPVPQ